MKYFLSILVVGCLLSFTSRKKEFIPPGTVKINDTLFADETEVSNFAWKEYEGWIKTKYGANSPEYKSVLPDTLSWMRTNVYCEPYANLYHWHPAFRDYPVVGVWYEQVLGYCKWRTDRVKDFLVKKGKYTQLDFEYRLPTKEEWEHLSYAGQMELSNNGFNQKGERKFNCIWVPDSVSLKKYKTDFDNADLTAPVYSYWKNFFGLFNMVGNVAEMVLEKNIAKGGSWHHMQEECRVGKDIPYEKPAAWLGFRCVCVVKSKKPC